ncbi:HdeD family acid-resistance protein [Streptomyces sp. NPDC086549]|uniref:HdeD family acid-resistance protein n=1 Tax=Streptomyces sp. NPDC086549 TaxID=3365752 RepID=UPI0038000EBA
MLSSPNALLWRGLLAVAVGVIAVVWPGITIGVCVILFAVYAFMGAATDTMRAFSSDRVGPVFGWLLLALLSVVAGVVALAWPGITAMALTIWIAAYALATGALEVGLAFQRGEKPGERALFILTGLVSIAGLRPVRPAGHRRGLAGHRLRAVRHRLRHRGRHRVLRGTPCPEGRRQRTAGGRLSRALSTIPRPPKRPPGHGFQWALR